MHEEIAKFNDQKNAEHARIAKIRSEIQTERAKGTAKKDAARIKELEAEVAKWKAKANGYGQKISEQNIRIRELKGEVDVREQTYDENMIKIRKYAQQLFDIGQTNARLETKVKSLQEKLEKEQQKNVDAQNKQQQQQPAPGIGPRATRLSNYNQSAGGGGTRTVNCLNLANLNSFRILRPRGPPQMGSHSSGATTRPALMPKPQIHLPVECIVPTVKMAQECNSQAVLESVLLMTTPSSGNNLKLVHNSH